MKALAADLIAALPAVRHEALQYHQRRLDATIAKSFEDAEEMQEAAIEDRQGLGCRAPTRIARSQSMPGPIRVNTAP
jgi:hypothetical protein